MKESFVRFTNLVHVNNSTLDNRPLGSVCKTIVDRSQSRALRVRSGIELIDRVIPGFVDAFTRHTLRQEQTPFKEAVEIVPLGSGVDTTVYKAKIGSNFYALKVDQKSLYIDDIRREERAKKLVQTVDNVFKLFSHLPELIPSTSVVIGKSPILDQKAVMVLQPYIPDLVDIFEVPQNDLKLLLTSNNVFRKQLADFISVVDKQMLNLEGPIIDLLGSKNLCITSSGNLVYLDTHGLLEVGTKHSTNYKKTAHRLFLLSDLLTTSVAAA